MLRHQGKNRTHKHNLRLATLLSFIAGLVNITGVLFLNILTTNVTGHFAFFAEEISKKHYELALLFLLYILSFLSGSFIASLFTEFAVKKNYATVHKSAILLEIFILLFVGISADHLLTFGLHHAIIACALLFSMGIQNSLVTQISKSTVRTTHLTGLFTDLGIELAQLIFNTQSPQKENLIKSINLRLAIIFFFFLGCVIGGYMYSFVLIKTLVIASALLAVALIYDSLLFKFYKRFRKHLR